jgi:DNA-binding CsgD family transcriptional regulator
LALSAPIVLDDVGGSSRVPKGDDFIATIEAIHAAGLNAEHWPQALAGIARTVGGRVATIEAFDKPSLRHREFLAHGLPPLGEIEYLDHYAALNLRLPSHTAAKVGEIIFDYRILDEDAMRRAPFYTEFLPRIDCRYFVSGIIAASAQEFAAVTVQRSPRQGHIDRAGIATMQRLVPHVQQAFDVARRLKGAGEARHSLERALDWLADGVVLVRPDGTIVYANAAMQAIARRGDGIAIKNGSIELTAADARTRLSAALAASSLLLERGAESPAVADFPVARRPDAPPYLVAVRPLPADRRKGTGAAAIVFVRDPSSRNTAALRMLREVFGLTEAEAAVAQALQAGIALGAYAREHAVSLNTIYTHLRRIREKTGCNRMAELIAKLNDLQVPLRIE